MGGARAMAALLAGVLAATLGVARTSADLRELPDPLPFAPSVKDPVFAILLGLLDTESHGRLSREHLEREIARRKTATRLPYQKVALVSRRAREDGPGSDIALEFLGPVKVPVPYSILGYRPGDILATASCRLRERKLGDVALGARGDRFEDVRLLTVEEGGLQVDIDALVDLLAGGALDDTRVTGLAVLRHQGRRLGVAFGYNDDERARYGVFDFGADKILIPLPAALKGVPGDLRRRAEAREGMTAGGPSVTAGP
ncbi:MAG TPA: hypothetical protein VIC87_12800 [Vicinamibacteria bacterium]